MTPEIYHYLRQTSKFIGRYHAIIFFSAVTIIVGATVFLLYLVLETTFTPPQVAGDSIGNFDQATINRIKSLNDSSSSQNSTVTLPPSRPNPFVE